MKKISSLLLTLLVASVGFAQMQQQQQISRVADKDFIIQSKEKKQQISNNSKSVVWSCNFETPGTYSFSDGYSHSSGAQGWATQTKSQFETWWQTPTNQQTTELWWGLGGSSSNASSNANALYGNPDVQGKTAFIECSHNWNVPPSQNLYYQSYINFPNQNFSAYTTGLKASFKFWGMCLNNGGKISFQYTNTGNWNYGVQEIILWEDNNSKNILPGYPTSYNGGFHTYDFILPANFTAQPVQFRILFENEPGTGTNGAATYNSMYFAMFDDIVFESITGTNVKLLDYAYNNFDIYSMIDYHDPDNAGYVNNFHQNLYGNIPSIMAGSTMSFHAAVQNIGATAVKPVLNVEIWTAQKNSITGKYEKVSLFDNTNSASSYNIYTGQTDTIDIWAMSGYSWEIPSNMPAGAYIVVFKLLVIPQGQSIQVVDDDMTDNEAEAVFHITNNLLGKCTQSLNDDNDIDAYYKGRYTWGSFQPNAFKMSFFDPSYTEYGYPDLSSYAGPTILKGFWFYLPPSTSTYNQNGASISGYLTDRNGYSISGSNFYCEIGDVNTAGNVVTAGQWNYEEFANPITITPDLFFYFRFTLSTTPYLAAIGYDNSSLANKLYSLFFMHHSTGLAPNPNDNVNFHNPFNILLDIDVVSLPCTLNNAIITPSSDTTTLTASVQGTLGNISYVWKRNGQTLSETTNVLNVTQNGVYTVVITDDVITNPPCIAMSAPFSVVNFDVTCDLTNAQITANIDTTTLTASIQGANGNISYVWKRNGQVITAANTATINVSQNGVYQVIITDDVITNPPCTKTVSFTVTNFGITCNLFDAAIVRSGDNLSATVQGQQGNLTYTWSKDDVPLQNTTSTIPITAIGVYKVIIVDDIISMPPCIAMSAPFSVVNFGVTLNEVSTFNVYPNPSTGLVHIVSSEDGQASVFDAIGRVVNTFVIKAGEITQFTQSAAGMYFVQLNGKVQKLVIE